MDPAKRKTIVNEIEYWRSSKLLPEHYCDFLRNLYVEGEDHPGSDRRDSSKRSKHALWKRIAATVALPLFMLIFIYFTSFHPMMQIALSIMLVLLLFAAGIMNRSKRPTASFLLLGAGAIFSLFLGIIILRTNGMEEEGWTVSMLAACGSLWIAGGVAARRGLLQLCGHFVLLLSSFWVIVQIHPSPSWLTLQLYSLPVCFLLYYLGKLLYKGIGSTGFILLVVSGLYLLAPEIFGLLFTDISNFILYSALVIKLIAAGVAIRSHYITKKQSVEWFADHE